MKIDYSTVGKHKRPVIKGSFPVSCIPIITIRATQKKRISQPVSKSCSMMNNNRDDEGEEI